MRLTKVRIKEFKSIQDSTEVEIGDVTCLVGKNESGKTAVLQALYRLNPVVDTDGSFDVTDDYPRKTVSNYKTDVAANRREPTDVVHATYKLERDDIMAIEATFGASCLIDEKPEIVLHKGYLNKLSFRNLNVDENAALSHVVQSAGLPQQLTDQLLKHGTVERLLLELSDAEPTAALSELMDTLQQIANDGVTSFIFNHILYHRIPKFLYFDEYYQLKGQDNLDALQQRVAANALENPDRPLLGLIDLAGLELGELVQPERTQVLFSILEAAANQLTQAVLPYWSQNKHLRMRFDIRPGQPGDPQGMTSGTNIWGLIDDTKHMVSTSLGTRSRGFVWFFSFVAWYSQLRQDGKKLILLLDEPGLSLHGRAQGDLLRYFEEQLKPNHQLIYTTHSLFMIDSAHFERVRIVQDLSIEPNSDDLSEEEEGTRVITEILDATPDSLFPLQGALGHEIYQTLFIGPNCLVVEGASDLLYIQSMSALLERRNRVGLSNKWTITPVGGSDKVPTFVALIGAQTHLNVAVLIDFHKKDQQNIETLYKRKLLKRRQVLTFADFAGNSEADLEDMFDLDFYLSLVNGEFGCTIQPIDLTSRHPRVLCRLEEYLGSNPLPNGTSFNHYRPARYFNANIDSLAAQLSDGALDRFEGAFRTLNALL
ncbi:MAG: AAA family ATPase [Caldilineaceae bacterium SB0662_bin_9]|uniref:AAA family ATPase n=1 Tax=Caldilineaceae bacterium SB0662_bin_9 TaxID=2605258 RepID=A0A6B1DY27_9CHLR|nr:AAA family ATPase [Caldilineaceae bacterium SB0662_bin_9]